MGSPRHADWNLPPEIGTTNSYSWDKVKVALLMDIRDALRPLLHLDCHRFQMIPTYLQRIAGEPRPNRSERLRRRAEAHRRAVKRARFA